MEGSFCSSNVYQLSRVHLEPTEVTSSIQRHPELGRGRAARVRARACTIDQDRRGRSCLQRCYNNRLRSTRNLHVLIRPRTRLYCDSLQCDHVTRPMASTVEGIGHCNLLSVSHHLMSCSPVYTSGPTTSFLESHIFPVLEPAMEAMLRAAIKTEASCDIHHTSLQPNCHPLYHREEDALIHWTIWLNICTGTLMYIII